MTRILNWTFALLPAYRNCLLVCLRSHTSCCYTLVHVACVDKLNPLCPLLTIVAFLSYWWLPPCTYVNCHVLHTPVITPPHISCLRRISYMPIEYAGLQNWLTVHYFVGFAISARCICCSRGRERPRFWWPRPDRHWLLISVLRKKSFL